LCQKSILFHFFFNVLVESDTTYLNEDERLAIFAPLKTARLFVFTVNEIVVPELNEKQLPETDGLKTCGVVIGVVGLPTVNNEVTGYCVP